MKNYYFILLILLLLYSCNSKPVIFETPTAQDGFMNYFSYETNFFNTNRDSFLHFHFIDNEILEEGELIPDSLIQLALNDTILENTGLKDGAANCFPQYYFIIDETYDAYVVYITENWYHFQYLLIYNKEYEYFEKSYNVFEFIGGDGGQEVSESWLFGKELYTKISSHHYDMMSNDEPQKVVINESYLEKWESGKFLKVVEYDSIDLDSSFLMKWSWDDF